MGEASNPGLPTSRRLPEDPHGSKMNTKNPSVATGCSLRRLVAGALATQFSIVFEKERSAFEHVWSRRQVFVVARSNGCEPNCNHPRGEGRFEIASTSQRCWAYVQPPASDVRALRFWPSPTADACSWW